MASPFCWKTSRWRGTNEAVKQSQLPHDVEMTLTRNYGETAAEKSTELLAVVFVSVLIAFTLGRRELLIVFIGIAHLSIGILIADVAIEAVEEVG